MGIALELLGVSFAVYFAVIGLETLLGWIKHS